jgi:hypothetical protein
MAMATFLVAIAIIAVGGAVLLLVQRSRPEPEVILEPMIEPPLGNVTVIEREPEEEPPLHWKSWDKRNPNWGEWL